MESYNDTSEDPTPWEDPIAARSLAVREAPVSLRSRGSGWSDAWAEKYIFPSNQHLVNSSWTLSATRTSN